jgi:hypothetical protein
MWIFKKKSLTLPVVIKLKEKKEQNLGLGMFSDYFSNSRISLVKRRLMVLHY